MAQPPAFENKSSCNQCSAVFGLLTRKHHCRNCGKTFCGECSNKNVPIPAYGFVEPARVCNICYESITAQVSTTMKPGTVPGGSSAPIQRRAAPAESKKQFVSEDTKSSQGFERRAKCVCNMPLCICPPDPSTEKKDSAHSISTPILATTTSASSSTASKPTTTTFLKTSTPSVFTGFGTTSTVKYDLNGDLNEQCRDAIKAGDAAGVTQLLKVGASAQYVDRTGNTLLHLAAMFNRLDLVLLLVKNGADVNTKNPAGETAIDLAPPSLQHKMKQPNFAN